MNNIEKVIKERVKKNTFFKKSHKNWFFFFFLHHLSKFNIASMLQEIFFSRHEINSCCYYVMMMNGWKNWWNWRGKFWMLSKKFITLFFRMISLWIYQVKHLSNSDFFSSKYQYLECLEMKRSMLFLETSDYFHGHF